jgi:hypothetical protein
VATQAQKLAALRTEETRLSTAIATAQSGVSSFSVDGFSATQFRMSDLRDELTRVRKSIRRLLRGGRGMLVDMSAGVPGDAQDPYRSGGEVLL